MTNLDKVTQNFLENLKIEKPLYEISPEEARIFLENIQKKYHSHINAKVEDITIFSPIAGEISIRLVRPENTENQQLPLIIYCHGGGWVMGDADVYDMTIRTIANRTNSVVAFINYPRSPEFKYPEAISHIKEAIEVLSENGSNYNINTAKIALVGDSAGANMAIAATLKHHEDVKISFLALIYPVTSSDMNTQSYKDFKNGPWLSKKAMEYFFNCYLCDKSERKDIYVSPLNAYIDELAKLPSTLIITAENDPLRDEGETFARKLIDADVDVACVRLNNTIHDSLLLNGLRESKVVKAGYKILCKFLEHALHD